MKTLSAAAIWVFSHHTMNPGATLQVRQLFPAEPSLISAFQAISVGLLNATAKKHQGKKMSKKVLKNLVSFLQILIEQPDENSSHLFHISGELVSRNLELPVQKRRWFD